jgi:hypothetical protein
MHLEKASPEVLQSLGWTKQPHLQRKKILSLLES